MASTSKASSPTSSIRKVRQKRNRSHGRGRGREKQQKKNTATSPFPSDDDDDDYAVDKETEQTEIIHGAADAHLTCESVNKDRKVSGGISDTNVWIVLGILLICALLLRKRFAIGEIAGVGSGETLYH